MPRRAHNIEPLRAHPRVAYARVEDDDRVWVDLDVGWCDGSRGCHSIDRDTVADALADVENATPCDCASCVVQGRGFNWREP